MTIRHRRRILIIARSLPDPVDEGYRIRVRALARGLARQHDVTLVGHVDGDATDALASLRADGIAAHPVPDLHHATAVRRARRFASGRPWFTRSSDQPELRALIGRLTRDQPFDLIQLESSEFAGLPVPAGTPVVIDEHNIWSELMLRRRAVRPSPARGLIDRLEAAQLANVERRAWSAAAGVAFCSAREVDIARRRVPKGTYASIPNGFDSLAFEPAAADLEQADRLVFVGLLRYTPNADAMRWFCTQILPIVRETIPGAHLDVVGKEPPAAVRLLAGPGVEVSGTVPDVRPSLARASVVVVPLRVASGTRIKILQAFAMAKPVVTTSIGCEGLDVRDGEHVLIADDERSFAAAVCRLLEDPALRRQLGDAGRRFVADGHQWSHSVERLEAFHTQILAHRTASPQGAA